MYKRNLLVLILLLSSLSFLFDVESASYAQSSARLLTPFVAVTGELNNETYTEEWTLQGLRGQPISIVVKSSGGDLNPIVSLLDSSGTVLAANDDTRLNDFTARLENFILPADDTYTVQVGRLGLERGRTAGTYELVWLDGAGSIFSAQADLDTRLWLTRSQKEITISLAEIDTANAHLQTMVQFTSAPDNLYTVDWQFGMWHLSWSPDGRWQLEVRDAENSVVDSTQGASDILANPEFSGKLQFSLLNQTFQLMIDNEIVVTYSTSAELTPQTAAPQIIFGIDSDPNGSPSIAVRETSITRSYYVDEDAETVAIPPLDPAHYIWDYDGIPSAVLSELVDAGLAQSGGGVNAIARDGYIYNYEVGFSAYPLFIERNFSNFVVGYTGIILEGSPDTACGLLFQQTDGSNFATVMFTPQRELYMLDYVDGVPSENSILLNTPYLAAGLEAHNSFLLIVQDSSATLYLNGRLVDEFTITAEEGAMYVQVVLEQQQSANCLLQGLWVWEW